MNEDRQPSMSTHSWHFSGFLSRNAAFFVLAAMCLGMGLLAVFLGLTGQGSGVLLGGIIVSCLSLVILIPVYLGLTQRPSQVQVTEEGLVWKGKQGEQRCRWEEISEVYRSERIVNQTFRENKLTWVLDPGKKVTVDQSLRDWDGLADAVQARTEPHLLAAKRSSLDGTGAKFGPVVLERTRLTIGGKQFPWEEIGQSTIFNGTWYVFPKEYKGNNSEEAKLTEMPNCPVFLQMLDEIGQTPVPVEQSILYTGRK